MITKLAKAFTSQERSPVRTSQLGLNSAWTKGKYFVEEHDATLLGISVDNIPTLHSWTKQMGNLWFDVLSDFWPHGVVASQYGILRSDGTAERAIIIIDKKGIIRYIDVHDINERPPLESIIRQLEKMR